MQNYAIYGSDGDRKFKGVNVIYFYWPYNKYLNNITDMTSILRQAGSTSRNCTTIQSAASTTPNPSTKSSLISGLKFGENKSESKLSFKITINSGKATASKTNLFLAWLLLWSS